MGVARSNYTENKERNTNKQNQANALRKKQITTSINNNNNNKQNKNSNKQNRPSTSTPKHQARPPSRKRRAAAHLAVTLRDLGPLPGLHSRRADGTAGRCCRGPGEGSGFRRGVSRGLASVGKLSLRASGWVLRDVVLRSVSVFLCCSRLCV